MNAYKHQNLWEGCVGAWCPSQDRSSSTLLTDFSTSNSHGTLTNMDAATARTVHQGRKALNFVASSDDLASCGVLPILDGLTEFSVSLWVYGTGAGVFSAGRIISRNDISSFALIYGGSISTLNFRVNGSADSIVSVGNLNTSWRHVACVYQSGVRKEVWVDRILYTNATVTGALASTTVPVVLGNRLDGARGAGVYLDDVRIYSHALTPSQIDLLSLRPGIAFETRRRRSYAVAGGSGITALVGYGGGLVGTRRGLVA